MAIDELENDRLDKLPRWASEHVVQCYQEIRRLRESLDQQTARWDPGSSSSADWLIEATRNAGGREDLVLLRAPLGPVRLRLIAPGPYGRALSIYGSDSRQSDSHDLQAMHEGGPSDMELCVIPGSASNVIGLGFRQRPGGIML